MGKEKRSNNKPRHNPLAQEILKSNYAQPSSRDKRRSKHQNSDKFVDTKLTNGILKQAQQQQEDLIKETGFSVSDSAPLFCSSESETLSESGDFASDGEDEVVDISEEDKKALEKLGEDNVAEIIKDTLTEKQTEMSTLFSDIGSVLNDHCSEEKVKLFQQLAPALKGYRSGKLPKLFKAIPRFTNWEEILKLTEPDNWSAATMYHATRMFSSNLQDKMAQRFYNLFLLPRVRDELKENKCLTVHLYKALQKSLYKPAAFFKGIIIPLCKASNEGDCTLKEATIIGSILTKSSIPVLHSSAALLTIAELEYSGVNSIFMRILLEKRYALPFRVINGVVDHFLRFTEDKSKAYPLLWHQCLLAFVQIYKTDLSPEQKTKLLELLTVHKHEKVTPEIRKALKEQPDLNDVMQHLWKM